MRFTFYFVAIFAFQISISQNVIVKDLDYDSVKDSVYFDESESLIVCKLSSKKYHPIKSKLIGNVLDNAFIKKTKSGFEFSNNFMRGGYAGQFRCNKKTKNIELIGISRYEFGPANNDGSGESSVNLLTNNYIGEWNVYDLRSETLIKLPTIKEKMFLDKKVLQNFNGSIIDRFIGECYELYKKAKTDYKLKKMPHENYNMFIKKNEQDINFSQIAFSEIPAQLKYEGTILNAVKWNDKQGEHIILLCETGIFTNPNIKHENDGFDAELYAYHYIKNGGQNYKRKWRVYDFVHDCPVDIEANFVNNTFHITDLDRDKIPEVWLVYTKSCRGDVSPSDMKVIMYEGDKKFAMRGQTKIQMSETNFYGGNYEFDESFTAAPKSFLSFAKSIWANNVEPNN